MRAAHSPARAGPRAPKNVALAVSALLGLASASHAAPRSLVDRSLVRTSVDLLGWTDESVAYRDSLGRVRQEPIGRYVAVLPGPRSQGGWARPADEDLAGGTPVVIELVDGERLLGSVGPWESASVPVPTPADETVSVLTPGFGASTLPLDRISRVVIDPWTRGDAPHAFTPSVDDELILANGDRLRGFLVEFGEQVRFDSGQAEQTIPLDRVAEVRLGNPAETWQGPRVWWTTGDVRAVHATGEAPDGEVAFTDGSGTPPVEFIIGAIEAVWLDGASPIPLAGLPVEHYEPLGGRRWTPPVRTGSEHDAPLGTPHVALPGPMRVEWLLPPDAAKFGAIARMGGTLDDPDAEAGRWANAVLRIGMVNRGEETEILSVKLDRSTPLAPIAVELPDPGVAGRTLVVELLPGLYGPIQDRVLLDRPMLTGL
ncbi:MAG: hypothetical protein H6810_09380 [Phycisphaeraceae bacterium]|nr:MAG: hypothetical protein H6810_09380 [Phycisphaeraceae bacterium]